MRAFSLKSWVISEILFEYLPSNGDKLFIINQSVGASDIGNDSISQVKLSCFFGIGACRTDIVSGIGSHVETAKRNIHFNNSTMFKRFEWIKRNRDNENLNSFNINLKSYNPILASLTKFCITSICFFFSLFNLKT